MPVSSLEAPKDGEPVEAPAIHRILVALDASADSRAALAAAVDLAALLHAELVGLFVEDINLLRLVELPFAREVRFAATAPRRLEREELQRNLRARAAVLRRELEEMTAESKVPAAFQVLRGAVERELLAAAGENDILAVGRLGHSPIRRARLGSTARAVVARGASTILLARVDVEGRPVVALYDGSAAGERVLRLAADLAGRDGDLRVLVWASDAQIAFERRRLAEGLLAEAGVPTQFQHLAGDEPRRVIEWVNRQKGKLLILSPATGNLPADVAHVLLYEAEQNVLIIR
jgi:nucleotide-binding universal stress UspA family protein